MRARSMEGFSRMVGGVKPQDGTLRERGVPGWKLAVGSFVIVAIVLIATLLLWFHGYLGGSSSASGASRVDLCQNGQGQNCDGYQVTLPALQNGRESNVSMCDSIVPTASGQHLVLSYATSTSMYGVLAPSVLYWGTDPSFSENPAGFFDDPAATSQLAWSSGYVTGTQSIDVSIPSGYPQWCLAWYDPGPYGLIAFDSNAYLAS
jgi:hypothetical protein